MSNNGEGPHDTVAETQELVVLSPAPRLGVPALAKLAALAGRSPAILLHTLSAAARELPTPEPAPFDLPLAVRAIYPVANGWEGQSMDARPVSILLAEGLLEVWVGWPGDTAGAMFDPDSTSPDAGVRGHLLFCARWPAGGAAGGLSEMRRALAGRVVLPGGGRAEEAGRLSAPARGGVWVM